MSAVWYSGGLPAGRDTLAKIYFHTGSNWKSTKGVVIDSTTYYPPPTGARFEFIDEATANTFIPILSKGCLGATIKLTSPNGGRSGMLVETTISPGIL